ncbi:MAG: recombinase family protein [Nitrososphaerota archaeon]
MLTLIWYKSHTTFHYIVYLPYLFSFFFLLSLNIDNRSLTLDDFLKRGSDEGTESQVIESRESQALSDEHLRNAALKVLLPEIDEIERLEGGRGLRVAAYLRVSTQRQAKKGASLMAQKDELRELAKRMGASVIYWFIDAKSGVSFVERKLNAIYRLAEMGLVDKVVTREIDRMGRVSYLLLAFIIIVRTLGVTTVVPSGELDVKRWQDMVMVTIKSVMAEEENVKRTKSALSSKIYNFKHKKWNMPIPLGYRKNANGWIEKIPEYESVIKDMFNSFLVSRSYEKVANYINMRYGKLMGKNISPETIKSLLTNPVYIGKPSCGKEKTKAILDNIEMEIEDPSLVFVDTAIFEKVQEIIKKKELEYERKKKPLDELIEILGEDVLEIFDNLTFLCPVCQVPMIRNGQSYKCPKCPKRRRLIKKSEVEKLAEWILKREKALKAFQKILEKVDNVDDIVENLREHGINIVLT